MERVPNEIAVLLRCQQRFKLPAKPVISWLLADHARPNGPEPPCPKWIKFIWPKSGTVGERF